MENPTNLNILKVRRPRSGTRCRFLRHSRRRAPVQPGSGGPGAALRHSPVQEGGQPALPAFTARTTEPALYTQSLAETAALFFHARPMRSLSSSSTRRPASPPPIKLQARISLLAGFKLAGKSAKRPGAENSLGPARGAYLYDLAAARGPASRTVQAGDRAGGAGPHQKPTVQKHDPEALLCPAVIHRKTGNTALARKTLSALGQGTQLEERRVMEAAWLDLEEGKEEEAEKVFQRLSSSAFDKTEALSGLGAAMAKTAFRTKDRNRLAAAASALRSALSTPSPASVHIFFQLGNLYFRSGDAAQAEACYRRSAALAPAVQARPAWRLRLPNRQAGEGHRHTAR